MTASTMWMPTSSGGSPLMPEQGERLVAGDVDELSGVPGICCVEVPGGERLELLGVRDLANHAEDRRVGAGHVVCHHHHRPALAVTHHPKLLVGAALDRRDQVGEMGRRRFPGDAIGIRGGDLFCRFHVAGHRRPRRRLAGPAAAQCQRSAEGCDLTLTMA